MDSVGEGEGGKIWENDIETCIISCMKQTNKQKLMEASCWDRLTVGETGSCSDGRDHAQ